MRDENKTVYEGNKTISEEKTVLEEDIINLKEDILTQQEAPAGIIESKSHHDENPLDLNDNPSVEFKLSDILMKRYRIDSYPIVGGMGKVWKVYHFDWGIPLALKQPKAELFKSEQQKENFINECIAWIGLGFHPNIVSCYFVQEINGIPSILSEWMDGGSLKHWIQNGRLYKHNWNPRLPKGREHISREFEVLRRILDISIQFAQGLRYIHEAKDEYGESLRLIHQDVKPDNLMLTESEIAKVTDFGIAKAREKLITLQSMSSESDTTIVSASGAYTPAYCSPEQLNGQTLTRRTDIYSWAVSVMEMFIGERLWDSGVVAGLACEEYFSMKTRSKIPERMKKLLLRCLAQEPEKRPHDFEEIQWDLLQIYQEECEEEYPRPLDSAAATTPDSLNNRALSFLEIGMQRQAEECWERALRLQHNHSVSLYNRAIYEWKKGKIDDLEAIRRVLNGAEEDRDIYLMKIYLSVGNSIDARSLLVEKRQKHQWFDWTIDPFRSRLDDLHSTKQEMKPMVSYQLQFDGEEFRQIVIDEFLIIEALSYRRIRGALGEQDILEVWDVVMGERTEYYVCPDELGEVISMQMDAAKDRALIIFRKAVVLMSVHPLRPINIVLGAESFKDSYIWEDLFERMIIKSDSTPFALLSPTDDLVLIKSIGMIKMKSTIGKYDLVKSIVREFAHIPDVISLSPEGERCLLVFGRYIYIYEVDTGVLLRELCVNFVVTNACFAPESYGHKIMCSCSESSKVSVWDYMVGICELEFKVTRQEDLSRMNKLQFIPFGNLLMVYGIDGIIFWRLDEKRCLRSIVMKDLLYCLIEDDREEFFTVTKKGEIKLWQFGYGAPLEMEISRARDTSFLLEQQNKTQQNKEEIESLIEAKDIQEALRRLNWWKRDSGVESSAVYRELRKKVAVYCKKSHPRIISKTVIKNQKTQYLCFSRDGKKIWFQGEERQLAAIDVSTRQVIQKIEGVSGLENRLCFSEDGRHIAGGSENGTIQIWDVESGHLLRNIDAHDGEKISAICFTPDDQWLITGGQDRKIYFWSTEDENRFYDLEEHKDEIVDFCVHLTGEWMASASSDGIVIIRNFKDKVKIAVDTKDFICSMRLSPNGKEIFCGCMDKIKIYDKKGMFLREVSWDNWVETVDKLWRAEIDKICFTSDGCFGFLKTYTDGIGFWNLKSGEKGMFEFPESCYDCDCSPDGFEFVFTNRKPKNQEYDINLIELDYELNFPGWLDWDEEAEPYLEIFRTLYPKRSQKKIDEFMEILQKHGFGYLRREGVLEHLKG